MSVRPQGYRVAVAGSSSLLGKELLAVLKERSFPVARLITAESDEGEPELPVMDLREGFEPVMADAALSEADLEFIFVAAPPAGGAAAPGWPEFLRSPAQLAACTHAKVIDLSEGLAGETGGALCVPWLQTCAPAPRFFISPHPAAIALATLLERLQSHAPLARAVAQIFVPASEFGSLAVEELQKQTVALLSFQKIPQSVFGQQLAFNLLPRFHGGRRAAATLDGLQTRIQRQVEGLLGERAPLPALRVVQAPVFHSLVFSLYVETAKKASPQELARALAGGPVEMRRHAEEAPSPATVAGSGGILVDALQPDALSPHGVWIWAVADNLRLAALNAVEIAEQACQKRKN